MLPWVSTHGYYLSPLRGLFSSFLSPPSSFLSPLSSLLSPLSERVSDAEAERPVAATEEERMVGFGEPTFPIF